MGILNRFKKKDNIPQGYVEISLEYTQEETHAIKEFLALYTDQYELAPRAVSSFSAQALIAYADYLKNETQANKYVERVCYELIDKAR